MNVLLINDSTSNPNWGDRAAAISLKKMIAEIGGNIINSISEDELKSLSFFDDESTLRKGERRNSYITEKLNLFLPPIFPKIKEKLVSNFFKKSYSFLIPQSWEDFDVSAKALIESNRFQYLRNIIEETDIAVIHGDGCMVGNGIFPRTQLFLSFLIKIYFKKPIFIINHTADFDHPNLLKIAQQVYPLYDDVTFRDPISESKCKTFCNGRFVPDTAFLFEPALLENWKVIAARSTYFDVWPDEARFNPTKPYICLGGSSIFSYDSFPSKIIEDYSSLIAHIQSVYSGQLVLTVSDLVDQPVFRAIANKFELPLVGLTTPVQQAVDIIGNAQAYLGGRWHPSIFALRGGTPIIPLSSKTFKMQALIDMAGLPSIIFDALNLQDAKKAITDQLFCYLDQKDSLRKKIYNWAQQAAEFSWNNVLFLKDFDSGI